MIDDEYDKISGDMYVPKNLSLSKSSKIDGGFSELARDANNKLQDHAVFVPHGERDSSVSRTAKGLVDTFAELPTKDKALVAGLLALGVVAVAGVTYGTVKLAEVVRKRKAAKLESAKAGTNAAAEIELHEPSEEIALTDEVIPLSISKELVDAEDYQVITMTAEEWRELLRKAVLLSSFEERAWLVLASVRIEDGNENILEWQKRIKELSPVEVAGEIRLVLEAHPELQENEELAYLFRVFIKGQGAEDGDRQKRFEVE